MCNHVTIKGSNGREKPATSQDVFFRFSNNLPNKHMDTNGILYNNESVEQ